MTLTFVEKAFILHFQDDWQHPLQLQEVSEILEAFREDGTMTSNIEHLSK